MADYQLRSRIPQETADKLFEIMKELQEKTEAADVTLSSVTRQAVDDYINRKQSDIVSINADRLTVEDTEQINVLLSGVQTNEISHEAKRFFLMLKLELLRITDKKNERDPKHRELMEFIREEGIDKMTSEELKAFYEKEEKEYLTRLNKDK